MTPTCLSSGRVTTGTLVATGRNLLHGVIVGTNGTDDATVTVYDNTAGSGTVLFQVTIPGEQGDHDFMFPRPVRAVTGLYAAVSGTGAAATVFFG